MRAKRGWLKRCAPVLQGGHLSYEEVRGVLGSMLAGEVRPSLMAAFLIGQRMNIENEEEVRAHLDAVRHPEEALRVQVDSLRILASLLTAQRAIFARRCSSLLCARPWAGRLCYTASLKCRPSAESLRKGC